MRDLSLAKRDLLRPRTDKYIRPSWQKWSGFLPESQLRSLNHARTGALLFALSSVRSRWNTNLTYFAHTETRAIIRRLSVGKLSCFSEYARWKSAHDGAFAFHRPAINREFFSHGRKETRRTFHRYVHSDLLLSTIFLLPLPLLLSFHSAITRSAWRVIPRWMMHDHSHVSDETRSVNEGFAAFKVGSAIQRAISSDKSTRRFFAAITRSSARMIRAVAAENCRRERDTVVSI